MKYDVKKINHLFDMTGLTVPRLCELLDVAQQVEAAAVLALGYDDKCLTPTYRMRIRIAVDILVRFAKLDAADRLFEQIINPIEKRIAKEVQKKEDECTAMACVALLECCESPDKGEFWESEDPLMDCGLSSYSRLEFERSLRDKFECYA